MCGIGTIVATAAVSAFCSIVQGSSTPAVTAIDKSVACATLSMFDDGRNDEANGQTSKSRKVETLSTAKSASDGSKQRREGAQGDGKPVRHWPGRGSDPNGWVADPPSTLRIMVATPNGVFLV